MTGYLPLQYYLSQAIGIPFPLAHFYDSHSMINTSLFLMQTVHPNKKWNFHIKHLHCCSLINSISCHAPLPLPYPLYTLHIWVDSHHLQLEGPTL